jgi:hypothetical protein
MRTRDLKKLKPGQRLKVIAIKNPDDGYVRNWLNKPNVYVNLAGNDGASVRTTKRVSKTTEYGFLYACEIRPVKEQL